MRLLGLAVLGRLLLVLLLVARIVGLTRIVAGKLRLGRLVDVSGLASSLVFLLMLAGDIFLFVLSDITLLFRLSDIRFFVARAVRGLTALVLHEFPPALKLDAVWRKV
jgi:hypothetical protein